VDHTKTTPKAFGLHQGGFHLRLGKKEIPKCQKVFGGTQTLGTLGLGLFDRLPLQTKNNKPNIGLNLKRSINL
tara:strand:- start:1817 stop:2035 length:219 start_codon:yes stop_codon:yes gene_type:complete